MFGAVSRSHQPIPTSRRQHGAWHRAIRHGAASHARPPRQSSGREHPNPNPRLDNRQAIHRPNSTTRALSRKLRTNFSPGCSNYTLVRAACVLRMAFRMGRALGPARLALACGSTGPTPKRMTRAPAGARASCRRLARMKAMSADNRRPHWHRRWAGPMRERW